MFKINVILVRIKTEKIIFSSLSSKKNLQVMKHEIVRRDGRSQIRYYHCSVGKLTTTASHTHELVQIRQKKIVTPSLTTFKLRA